ncbi:LTA synthase family protein [Iodobacter ciconiae]|nr:LTA synthase family protein [Iodobacter ciconiae]
MSYFEKAVFFRKIVKQLAFILGPVLLLLLGRYFVDQNWSVQRLLFSGLLFAFLALVLNRWAATVVAIGLEGLLCQASWLKEGQTGEPLLARDLFEVSQGVSLASYLNWEMIAFSLLVACAVGVGVWKRPRFAWWRLALALLLPALLLIRIFDHGVLNKTSSSILAEHFKASYLSYNFIQNTRQNGLLVHLYQTAESVKLPSAGAHSFYTLGTLKTQQAIEPDVVLILCEACFTSLDDDHFITPIARLKQKGFSASMMLSPVYGGGTAEAEFEMLTGLSSAVLPGIDYQNYASSYRKDAATLVSRYKDAGYRTIGMHNFYGNFWKRSNIYPSFGFSSTRFVEEMSWKTRTWPDDGLLYDAALKAYAQGPAKGKTMLSLVTVMTHGNYTDRDYDGGMGDYNQRLNAAVKHLEKFVKQLEAQAKKRKRPLVIALIGDHKPSLTAAFYRKGVFDDHFFRSKGDRNDKFRFAYKLTPQQWRKRAEVPLFIKASRPDLAAGMIGNLAGKPMFCLPGELAQLLPKEDPFWGALSSLCARESDQLVPTQQVEWRKVFEPALFAERLF